MSIEDTDHCARQVRRSHHFSTLPWDSDWYQFLHGDFLPAEKAEELLADLQCWPYSKIWQKLVVLSLTGKLHFTCCIIFCWLCIPLSPHWLEHNSKDASSSYQNEWRSLPGYCMVVIKLLPTWNVCTIIPDAYRSRSPCTPGTLHRCIWYP